MGVAFLILMVIVIGVGLAATGNDNLQSTLTSLLGFFEGYLIPFLLGIAFLIFVFNAIRFFVWGSNESEGRENAKNLALYSLASFVFILSFWGIVNLLAGGIGLQDCGSDLIPDYIAEDAISRTPCTDANTAPTSNPGAAGGPIPPSAVPSDDNLQFGPQ